MSTKKKTETAANITIRPPETGRLVLHLVGDSPLIMHRFGQKAIDMIVEKQKGEKTVAKRPPKDPQAEYEDSVYRDPDGNYAMPSINFKAAMVNAVRHVDDLTMTMARQLFFVSGIKFKEWCRIDGKPHMREDWVRIGNGSTDIRYRAQFDAWSTDIVILFNAEMIKAESLANLCAFAGIWVGIGERRPEREGNTFGCWNVEGFKMTPRKKSA